MNIKLMSFNIQHCRNYITREDDIPKVIQTIKDENPDIVSLNEVFDNPKQASIIASSLGYHSFFGRAIYFKDIPYGNALISKYEFDEVCIIPIPDPPIKDEDVYYETRSIIKAIYKKLDLVVLVTHFGLAKSEQINAVNTILNVLDNISQKNIVLMGDFNIEDYKDNELLKLLDKRLVNSTIAFKTKELSFPSVNPIDKRDYIYTNTKIIESNIVNVVTSDHLPITAIISIKK